MSYSVKKYDNWISEQSRYSEKQDKSKVVYKPLDQTSFLIKYKNQPITDKQNLLIGQPIISGGKIIKPSNLNKGWNETFKFLERAREKADGPSYSFMRDLTDEANIIVYEVSKKLFAQNKTVITYTLYPRVKFDPLLLDQDVKTIDSELAAQYAIDDRTAAELKKKVLNLEAETEKKVEAIDREQNRAAKALPEQTKDAKKESEGDLKSIKVEGTGPLLSDLKYAGPNHPIYKAVDKTLIKIGKKARMDLKKEIFENPIFLGAEKELDNDRIGDNTIKVLSALMKAYDISSEDERGRPSELFNQQFADKISKILVTESRLVLDPFGNITSISKINESTGASLSSLLGGDDIVIRFIEELNKKSEEIKTSATKNLKYPIKFGTKNDDVKKAQRLIVDKLLNTKLNSLSTDARFSDDYKNFMKYKDDGDYGTATKNIVAILKGGFKLSETDGNTITKELIDKLNSIK